MEDRMATEPTTPETPELEPYDEDEVDDVFAQLEQGGDDGDGDT
jgi:hypothetical protein